MGLILVFDMDQTILDSSDPYLFDRPDTEEGRILLKQKIREALNPNVFNILRRASKLRPSGKVSGIFLLTNNSSRILVSAVDEVLFEDLASRGKYKTYNNSNEKEMPDKHYFFDAIMMRQHSSRPKTVDDNPPKRLLDISNMMKSIGIKEVSLKDIYFFDDIETHNLKSELNFMLNGKYSDHYIHITPPFHVSKPDLTVYTPILNALDSLEKGNNTKGGSRYKKSRKSLKRRRITKKYRYMI